MSVKLGIIGLGMQGSMYANAIKNQQLFGQQIEAIKGIELAAVCDISQERREWAAETLGEVKIFDDYQTMYDSGLIEAVLVVTPHYLHPQMAMDAMNKNLHVLVDKPAGVYTSQVKKMNEMAASRPELTFAMMFNQRTNPLYQKLKEIIDSGEIGEIRRSNWIITTWWRPQAYYNMSSWRATWEGEGGGVLINQAPHQLDLWQWLCGMPTKVFTKASFGGNRDIAVEDDVSTMVEYENGATGVFITCTHDIAGTDRFEIHGDKGKLIVEGSTKLTIKRTGSESQINAEITTPDFINIMRGGKMPFETTEEVHEFEDKWGHQHFAVMENFADAILNGAPLLAPGAEGIRALSLSNAMHLSSWLGEEVAMPIDEELYFAKLQEKIEEEKIQKQAGEK